MSHFTVLVIGENPEKQLAPFQENNGGDCPKEYLEWNSVQDDYDNIDDAVEDGYKLQNGVPGYMENPNAKWDWHQLGGRWTGFFKIKTDSLELAVVGEGGLMTPPAEKGCADQCLKGLIDFEAMKSSDRLIETFAVIKDGKWYEKGQMGWWASVSNQKNKDVWSAEYAKLLHETPNNILLSVYDCHI